MAIGQVTVGNVTKEQLLSLWEKNNHEKTAMGYYKCHLWVGEGRTLLGMQWAGWLYDEQLWKWSLWK